MAGFGEELRLERESREVSLEALCAETKVNLRHFEALEQNHFQELPGGVFRRGILRAYLKALHLDEQTWISRFDASLSEDARDRGENPEASQDAWVAFAENVKRNRATVGRRHGLRWFGVLVLLLLLGAAAWGLWHFELRALMFQR
jgi:cytoskeletal protein RodZ